MANTLASDLIVDILAEQAMNTLPSRLSSLGVFSTDFSNERSQRSGSGPRQTIQVELNSTAGSALENPTNFEVTSAVDSAVNVVMNHISRPVGLSVQDLNQGRRLLTKATKALESVSTAVMDVAMALVTETNYTTGPIDASGGFDDAILKEAWAAISDGVQKNIVLNGESYSKFLPSKMDEFDPTKMQGGIFGFDNFAYNNRFGAAGADIIGFSCSPGAMAVAAMLPADPGDAKDRDYIASDVVTVDPLGISVEFNVWFSRATRGHWMSYDVVFGAGVGDSSALIPISSASQT